jgi:hypothetical protein
VRLVNLTQIVHPKIHHHHKKKEKCKKKSPKLGVDLIRLSCELISIFERGGALLLTLFKKDEM